MSILMEPARKARDNFSEIIERDEPTIITRNGRKRAVVVPFDQWGFYEKLEELELYRLALQRKADESGQVYTLEEVLLETLARND
jgi:prevent-host-death family protein